MVSLGLAVPWTHTEYPERKEFAEQGIAEGESHTAHKGNLGEERLSIQWMKTIGVELNVAICRHHYSH